MYVNSIRIENYKGFKNSGVIELGRNWTVIVGRNNSGKTSLLECLDSPRFRNMPHRNFANAVGAPLPPLSILKVSLTVSWAELSKSIRNTNFEPDIPVPDTINHLSFLNQHIFETPSLPFSIYRSGGTDWVSSKYPSHGLFPSQSANNFSVRISPSPDRQELCYSTPNQNSNDTLPSLVGLTFGLDTYVFRAERRVAGTSPAQDHLTLQPDAANLAGALHYLYASNPRRFHRLLDLVRKVLPDIETITIPPIGGANVQIRVWNSGSEEEREDLAIPLEECGTGIGQVLAMLFVAMTAEASRLIVIDEPNSFLHPGASRTLMQLLRGFSQHQFVVTTHSPEVLGATQLEKLVVVEWVNGESRVRTYEGDAVLGIQTALAEVGARLSDVFGYDAIFWVEGKTEERCFPKLLEAAGKEMPARSAFVALVNTGDLEGSDARTILRAYKRLSSQSPFVPQAMSISIDREGRTEGQCHDLIKESDGLIRFLPRRTYENYLLHAGAIAAILKEADAACPVTSNDVQKWINQHFKDATFYSGTGTPPPDMEWQRTIDAPKFLHQMIGELTNHAHDFKSQKVTYSSALTDWLIKNDQPFLSELINYVTELPVAATATSHHSTLPSRALGVEASWPD